MYGSGKVLSIELLHILILSTYIFDYTIQSKSRRRIYKLNLKAK
jgi:hypothetical protein